MRGRQPPPGSSKASPPEAAPPALRDARMSRRAAAIRDQLRRMVERPETAEAMARAMKSMLRRDD